MAAAPPPASSGTTKAAFGWCPSTTAGTLRPHGIDATLQGRACAAAVDGGDVAPGAALTLGIRPEHLVLGQGEWQAKIVHVEALGEHSYVHLQWSDEAPMLVAKTQDESLRVGQTVAFSLPARAACLP